MASAFQSNAFQNNAFQASVPLQLLTDTTVLQKPINCVLAGNQEDEAKRKAIMSSPDLMKSIFRE